MQPKSRFRRAARAVRAGRLRRAASAAAQTASRAFGRGGVQEETVGGVVGEAARAVGRRARNIFGRRRG